MKIALCSLWLAVLSSFLAAQTTAPELATIAMKYKADISALEAQRNTALAQAQKPYETAMATAEKAATAAGNVTAVGVITAERAALTKGLMSPGLPPGLPKELQGPRKTYLDAVARIRTAEAPRRQALDAAYLRALTGIGAKAPKESELAKQVEAEKQRLIASAPTAAPKKVNSKNVIVNGTFDAVESAGHPSGWAMAEGYKVQKEGTNNVLHATSKVPAYMAMNQDILIPARARNVTLTGRVRGKVVSRDQAKSQGPPGVFVTGLFLDANETATGNQWMMLDGGSDDQWKNVTMTQKIPDDMKALRVGLVLKYVSGDFDFDDIEVEFR
jgi:hypothetical protein